MNDIIYSPEATQKLDHLVMQDKYTETDIKKIKAL